MPALLPAALFLCFSSGLAMAHEEPPKTMKEKKQQSRESARVRKSGIEKALVYKQKGSESPALIFETVYDTAGVPAEMVQYDSASAVEARSRFMYGADGSMLSDEDLDAGGKTSARITYKYGPGGLVAESEAFEETAEGRKKYRFAYSRGEREIVFTKYSVAADTETVEYLLKYLYDGDPDTANNTGIIKQKPDGSLVMKVTNAFDKKGFRTQKAIYGEKGQLLNTFLYKYNAAEDFTEIAKQKPDGSVEWRDKYAYDKAGNVSAITTYGPKNEKISIISYKYGYFGE